MRTTVNCEKKLVYQQNYHVKSNNIKIKNTPKVKYELFEICSERDVLVFKACS